MKSPRVANNARDFLYYAYFVLYNGQKIDKLFSAFIGKKRPAHRFMDMRGRSKNLTVLFYIFRQPCSDTKIDTISKTLQNFLPPRIHKWIVEVIITSPFHMTYFCFHVI